MLKLPLQARKQLKQIQRNAVDVIPEDELLGRIKEKGRLTVKFGVDPTAPDIHLGHSVVLLKLRTFQELGHRVILLIGDFTARVGDPSGRSRMRPPLSVEEIEANARTYRRQAFRILDPEKTEVDYNSRWLNPMSFAEVLELASYHTVARMLERDDFQRRYEEGMPIGLHEFLYPLMQAYDSVALQADVELGGTDQKFNLLLGRQIQRYYGLAPQIILTMPILPGLDGKEKMSKSLGNFVGVNEAANEMYGKLMSIPDSLIFEYMRLLTGTAHEEIAHLQQCVNRGQVHPKEAKQRLAFELVSFYHSPEMAGEAERRFEQVFAQGQAPEDAKLHRLDADEIWLVDLMRKVGFAQSSSEVRRLVAQGGVRWDQQVLGDFRQTLKLKGEHMLQVGKRRFARVTSSKRSEDQC